MDFEKIVNPVVKDIPPSGIRKFFDLANQMEGVISLGVGEPDFATPWTIREAAIYSIEKGKTFYISKENDACYGKLALGMIDPPPVTASGQAGQDFEMYRIVIVTTPNSCFFILIGFKSMDF